jgi:hypothetical protein
MLYFKNQKVKQDAAYVQMTMPFSAGRSLESLVKRVISLSSMSVHLLNSLRHCSTATPINNRGFGIRVRIRARVRAGVTTVIITMRVGLLWVGVGLRLGVGL